MSQSLYFCLQFRNNLEMFLLKLFDKIDEEKYQMKVRDTLNKRILVVDDEKVLPQRYLMLSSAKDIL